MRRSPHDTDIHRCVNLAALRVAIPLLFAFILSYAALSMSHGEQLKEFRQEAVKKGYATIKTDPETGNKTFRWKPQEH